MSRLAPLMCALVLLVLPVSAQAVDSVVMTGGLPPFIQTALHEAATTGNPLVVTATADRMKNLFPSYKNDIDSYAEAIAAPAAQVMANIDIMLAQAVPALTDTDFSSLFEKHDMTEEGEEAALATELNDLDVGAGMEEQALSF